MKEKSQFEKNAAEKQVELLSEALNNAIGASGHWLNATGKGYPRFYPKGVAVSPFNALFMALHSDKTGSKTNLFTRKRRAIPVLQLEQVCKQKQSQQYHFKKRLPATYSRRKRTIQGHT